MPLYDSPLNRYVDVTPRVIRAGRTCRVDIIPLYDHVRLQPGARYEVTRFRAEEWGLSPDRPAAERFDAHEDAGHLWVEMPFPGEQEHVLLIEEIRGDERRTVGTFRVYSAADDLYGRRPYKGDFHLHSSCSDGVEPPAYVAAACRRIGLDFMAVTDHHRYAPSLEAMAAYASVPIDLAIFPGEEVHPPDNPVHIINFGGRFSINERFSEKSRYLSEVSEQERKLGPCPDGVSPYHYASVVWCFDRIREAGGLGVFCHPYWFTSHRYTPSGALTSHLFDTRPFDAFELIGGFHRYEDDSNTLQVARYHEERAKGRAIPIVGASDSHGCERGTLFGWYYTLLFSESLDLPAIVDSVKTLFSVAVESLPGQKIHVHGPFRLVKFALFLLREVFPAHDALCAMEGAAMLDYLAGHPGAAERLAACKGQCQRLLDRIWPRP